MSCWQKIEITYVVVAVLSGTVTWFLSCENRFFRILSGVLTGLTWPLSFPVVLLFSLF